MIRTYTELLRIPSFIERYRYLKLGGRIGEETFGFDRYLNQSFYHSTEWQRIRREVIIRDNAYDLAHPDRPTYGRLIVHHMNPISEFDIVHSTDLLLDPEFLITTIELTHNAIHYGDESLLIPETLVERRPNDTRPWKSVSLINKE